MGFRCVVFSGLTVRIRPCGVKVSQADEPQVVRPAVVVENLFDHLFGSAVGIDGGLGVALVDGNAQRLAVSGA